MLLKWTLYLIETPFNAFANKVDPDQGLLRLIMDYYTNGLGK